LKETKIKGKRGHTISICYLAKGSGILKASSDAKDVETFKYDELPILAFDHNKMVKDAYWFIKTILELNKIWKQIY
jgi:8-oxo-dGTP diphosphatase